MLDRIKETVSVYAPHSYTILRIGLGFTMLIVGTHKLFQPGIWGSYLSGGLVDVITSIGVSMEAFMRSNGVLEALLGLAIIAEFHTTIAAGLVSLSMLGIVINLASSGTVFLDVLIRDLGLLVLSVGVTVLAARKETDHPTDSEPF